MKKLIVSAIILCLFSIAEARKCTVTGVVPLFTNIEAMAIAMEAFQTDKDYSKFLLGEMMASGYIVKPKLYDELIVLHTLPNGVCQVMLNGKIYYTTEDALKCRW